MRFTQVDVFSTDSFRGNPVAVVHDADHLSDAEMAQFANWTNLSETTFLLTPTTPEADYRLRIFTVSGELPFAGHPTLGSCRAWLTAGGRPRAEPVIQECAAGLVPIRRDGDGLAFAAPGFARLGPVEPAHLDQALTALHLSPDELVASAWIDNGPGWMGLVLRDAAAVLALEPDFVALGDLDVGVIGAHAAGGPADYEVRAFVPGVGINEDPVTGSLNAGFGVWLIESGAAPPSYTVAQGTVLGRTGRVTVWSEDGEVWVGGATRVRISGDVEF
ncbi:PhzF family phenazine biosynthesis protein [Nocardioides sp.]|uniref:PhzF family phenazine biosynthesis protein n=1 Tax=Nocardioides sp. TaxID=35761 RepID=UPI003D0EFED5